MIIGIRKESNSPSLLTFLNVNARNKVCWLSLFLLPFFPSTPDTVGQFGVGGFFVFVFVSLSQGARDVVDVDKKALSSLQIAHELQHTQPMLQ